MRWKLIKGFIKIVSFLRNDNFEKSREAWFLSFWFDAVSFIKKPERLVRNHYKVGDTVWAYKLLVKDHLQDW